MLILIIVLNTFCYIMHALIIITKFVRILGINFFSYTIVLKKYLIIAFVAEKSNSTEFPFIIVILYF